MILCMVQLHKGFVAVHKGGSKLKCLKRNCVLIWILYQWNELLLKDTPFPARTSQAWRSKKNDVFLMIPFPPNCGSGKEEGNALEINSFFCSPGISSEEQTLRESCKKSPARAPICTSNPTSVSGKFPNKFSLHFPLNGDSEAYHLQTWRFIDYSIYILPFSLAQGRQTPFFRIGFLQVLY